MAKLVQKELLEVARIIKGVHRASEENDPALDKQLEKINEIFADFNKKYPKISLKIIRKIDQLAIKIFINEESVKKVFDDAASKLKGLTGIGLRSFDEAGLQSADKFASIVNNIGKEVFLTYLLDFGSENIVLEWNEKEKKVELNYDIKALLNPLASEFQLLEHYASKESDKSINILEKCHELGFIDLEDEALFDWEDEFFPKIWE